VTTEEFVYRFTWPVFRNCEIAIINKHFTIFWGLKSLGIPKNWNIDAEFILSSTSSSQTRKDAPLYGTPLEKNGRISWNECFRAEESRRLLGLSFESVLNWHRRDQAFYNIVTYRHAYESKNTFYVTQGKIRIITCTCRLFLYVSLIIIIV
jgi:hypothetical protein